MVLHSVSRPFSQKVQRGYAVRASCVFAHLSYLPSQISPGTQLELGGLHKVVLRAGCVSLQSHATDPPRNQIAGYTRNRTFAIRAKNSKSSAPSTLLGRLILWWELVFWTGLKLLSRGVGLTPLSLLKTKTQYTLYRRKICFVRFPLTTLIHLKILRLSGMDTKRARVSNSSCIKL